jgi:phosphatidylserine/phosphatidylglycerophosphate/cardiolipin synthase-like enzyme
VSRRAGERLVIAPHLRRRTIVGAIRAARAHLVLSLFRCDDRAVLEALADAARRGVDTRVLMTARARAAGKDLDALHAWLTASGVDVRRFAGRMKYHAKYLVADAGLAQVTTASYTARCFDRTCDFTLVTRDPAVVSGLSALFDADWHGRPVTFTDAQHARLIVGPEHQPRHRFAALVCEARHRVRILDAKLADPRIIGVLEQRRRAGVIVERARRRQVRPLRRHGKLLIVDGAAAAIGSLALSARALEHRRELAIVTRDPRLVAELDAFWRTHVADRGAAVSTRARAAARELVP